MNFVDHLKEESQGILPTNPKLQSEMEIRNAPTNLQN